MINTTIPVDGQQPQPQVSLFQEYTLCGVYYLTNSSDRLDETENQTLIKKVAELYRFVSWTWPMTITGKNGFGGSI